MCQSVAGWQRVGVKRAGGAAAGGQKGLLGYQTTGLPPTHCMAALSVWAPRCLDTGARLDRYPAGQPNLGAVKGL